MTKTKKCVCGKLFEKNYYDSKKTWAKRRFCSISCSKQGNTSRLGISRPAWNKGKEGIYTKETLKQMSKTMKKVAVEKGFGKWMKGKDLRELSGNWKGEEVGYGALHDWVRRRLGTPNKCSQCGLVSDRPRMMHWASLSRQYKRDLQDWIRLCAKCHKDFDKDMPHKKLRKK